MEKTTVQLLTVVLALVFILLRVVEPHLLKGQRVVEAISWLVLATYTVILATLMMLIK